MKNTLILLVAISTALSATAQKGLTFIETNRLWCPEVQNQAQSGTCWCFSTLSFLESEMKAAGAEDIPNLSEMFVVRYSYLDKADIAGKTILPFCTHEGSGLGSTARSIAKAYPKAKVELRGLGLRGKTAQTDPAAVKSAVAGWLERIGAAK